METFLQINEGQSIQADIESLQEMGFEKKMIDKVYILLRPENIQRAIDYMTEIDGIYQHNFIPSNNPNEKNLCFICINPKENHLNSNEDHDHDIIDLKIDINKEEDEEMYKKEKENNILPCGYLNCNLCWFNYLKELIIEAKVDQIKCMGKYCYQYLTEEFVLNHISKDIKLIEKYKKFKKKNKNIK